jgi:hypothetical protein
MPRKEFESFTRLDASDVNTYLMDQTVMTFAGTAARGSAIGTATEGMVTWLNDENALQVYDGTAWNGLAASGGNAIINGAFEINQRSFSSSTASGFGFDRWLLGVVGDGTTTYSSQAFTLGSAPIAGYEAANHARIVTSGQTLTGSLSLLDQKIEGVRNFAGQTVTLSFFAKAGSGTPEIALEIGQNFGSGGSSFVPTLAGQVTLNTSWQRYSVTVQVPSIAGKTIGSGDFLHARFWFSAGSDFNARTDSLGIQSNTFDIWGVQLEAGPTANVFRRNANSIQGELAACQRYFFVLTPPTTGYTKLASGYVQNALIVQACGPVSHPVTMRAAPTVTFTFTSNNITSYDGAEGNVTGFRDASPFVSLDRTTFNVDTSGMTTNRAAHILHRAGVMSFASEL